MAKVIIIIIILLIIMNVKLQLQRHYLHTVLFVKGGKMNTRSVNNDLGEYNEKIISIKNKINHSLLL